ncbi:hypothetical protein ASH02_09950 [Nocardioides sp. Soil796]|nr:hypothetical protein ASH02_09950 [Nocardioides sp. Soil796]
MLKRLSPWQAAAAITAILLVVQVLLVLGEAKEPGAEELSPLSPQATEIAVSAAAFVFVFLVLWLVLSVPAALKAWRSRARGA